MTIMTPATKWVLMAMHVTISETFIRCRIVHGITEFRIDVHVWASNLADTVLSAGPYMRLLLCVHAMHGLYSICGAGVPCGLIFWCCACVFRYTLLGGMTIALVQCSFGDGRVCLVAHCIWRV